MLLLSFVHRGWADTDKKSKGNQSDIFGSGESWKSPSDAKKSNGSSKVVKSRTVFPKSLTVILNVEGISPLNLTPEVLASIFLGDITKWDDSAISELNPTVHLPSWRISIVHNQDGPIMKSFTQYLTKVSPKWAKSVGWGPMVRWPVGVGSKDSSDVAGMVQQIQGCIGYVDSSYAAQNQFSYAEIGY
jgi:ABC-type phosphate transport system substrate-binding protein